MTAAMTFCSVSKEMVDKSRETDREEFYKLKNALHRADRSVNMLHDAKSENTIFKVKKIVNDGKMNDETAVPEIFFTIQHVNETEYNAYRIRLHEGGRAEFMTRMGDGSDGMPWENEFAGSDYTTVEVAAALSRLLIASETGRTNLFGNEKQRIKDINTYNGALNARGIASVNTPANG